MDRKIAVLDFETDPFEFGHIPEPFAVGFYDGQRFVSFWSENCASLVVEFLRDERNEYTIYAHNGGKFDFWYLLPHLQTGDIKIINARIVQAKLGPHELRDSFAIMPFALDKYCKVKIDYDRFRRDVREQHREEITSYLRMDCVYLHELCVGFVSEFGDKLTVGSASLKQLKSFHRFKCGNENFDTKFRKDFYFGGRNQVFESGVLKGDFKVYDVNSMYPHVMRSYLHPVGTAIEIDKRITRNTCFVVVTGHNYGAFPVRTKTGGLDFTTEKGTFSTTIHEWNAALETGCFRPDKIVKTYGFTDRISFAEFVDHFYNLRIEATLNDDQMHKLFYKYVLNSGYGKFAQNPANYFDWVITTGAERPREWHDCNPAICDLDCRKVWTPAFLHDQYVIWQRPTLMHHFYNVATGASITGAARAVLLRGLHAATRPVYCDTDSILAEGLSGVPIDSEQLGAWKLESTCTLAAICGKKLYALFSEAERPCDETCVKKAHKGARLTGSQILRIAQGEVIRCDNPVPAFKFDGTAQFVQRKIRRTV